MNHASHPSTASDHAPTGHTALSLAQSQERQLPELYQVVIECRDEQHQREMFDRLSREGLKLRLLVL